MLRTEVIRREQIVIEGGTHLGEALEHVPGFYRSAAAGLLMDGLELRRVLVLEDGERVLLHHPSQLALADTDRIEIVRGPLSALSGSGAVAGVVHLLGAPPTVDGWSGLARLEARHRWGGYLTRTINLRGAGMWATFDASLLSSDSVRLGDEPAPSTVPSTKRQTFVFRAGAQLTPSLYADARFRYARVTDDVIEVDLDSEGRRVVDAPVESHRISARFRAVLELGRGAELGLSAGTQWLLSTNARDPRGTLEREAESALHTLHSVDATAAFGRGGALSGALGIRAEVERLASDLELRALAPAESSAARAPVDPMSVATGAAFAEVRFRPFEWLDWLSGVRVEGSSRFGPALAPRMAVKLTPSSWLTARAQVGRAFRAPTPRELGVYVPASTMGRVLGSERLEPEASWSVSTDVELSPLAGLFLVRARGYATWISDAIELAPVTRARAPTFLYENIGEARVVGLDADATIRLHEDLRAKVGYALVHARDLSRDLPLPGRPPHGVWAGVDATLAYGFTLDARLRAVIGGRDELMAGASEPTFALFDLRIAKALWAGAELYAGALDLFDVQPRGDPLRDLRPAEGRTIYLGLRFAYPSESPP
ncbi:MAG: TonB-dependent receptor [Polyangiaceae bacterium]|nr:TonB-dependent receptor [Polyangiaceae bacterium]